MKLNLLGLLLIAGVAFISCKKNDTIENPGTGGIDELKAPAGFTWSSSRDINMSIGITDNSFQNAIHVIKVYNGDPANGGQLLSKGSATLVTPYNTKITISSIVKEAYIQKISPNGETLTQKITLNSDNISVAMSATGAVQTLANAKTGKRDALSVANLPNPSIPSTATVVAAGSTNYQIYNGGVYVINTPGSYEFRDVESNGTLYITSGSVSINQLKIQSNLTVIVTSSANVTLGSSFAWDGTGTLKNFGTITAANNFKVSDNLWNQGNITINGELQTGSSSSGKITNTSTGSILVKGNSSLELAFSNEGSLTLQGGSNTFKSAAKFTNETSGTLVVQNNFDLNGTFTNNGSVVVNYLDQKSTLVNNCKFIVNTNAIFTQGTVTNNSYFKVAQNLTVQCPVVLGNSAMLTVGSANAISQSITGPASGARALFKSAGTIDNGVVSNSGQTRFYKLVDLCLGSNQPTPSGMFSGGAGVSCSSVISITNCNPEGNNAPAAAGDTDGVPDNEDDYDNDPLRAYNNKTDLWATGGYTFAFEDNWPLKGDYDLNDMVINTRYNLVTNAGNKVIDIVGDFILKATGGEFQNGFGVEFPVAREKVKGGIFKLSINGGQEIDVPIEAGQTNAVAILFNNSREQQQYWNTVKNSPNTSPVVNYSIRIELVDGPAIADFGVGYYNPFIWNNSKGRGYETHLFGKRPTSKATPTLFGTGNDSGTSTYYSTTDGLPWAIEIPASQFSYPVEQAVITQAYLQFQNWALSGGANSQNWYLNSDYIDPNKVYNNP